MLLAAALGVGPLGGCVGPTQLEAQVVPVERITLEEAVERALQRSPSYVQAHVAVGNARESQRAAFGSFLPSLSASTGSSLSSSTRFDPTLEQTVDATSRSMSAGLNMGMDLFTGGAQRAQYQQAGAEVEAATARLEGQGFQVAFQTKQVFFDALRQEDLVDVAEARVERARESLELVRRRVEQGSATASDSLRARLELANARQVALQSENQLRAARVSLGRQVGHAGPIEPARVTDLDPAPLPVDDEEIFRQAEEASPAVRAARASSAASDLQVASARASYLPSLRMNTGYNWSNSDFTLDQGRTSWSLSLSASYPIFNGFAREGNVERARQQSRLARTQEEDARLQARQEADQALQAVRTAEEAIALAEEAVTVAREDLRVVRQRFEMGVATMFEVVTSQVALDEAEVDRISARYNYHLARAQLEAVLGREL